MKAGIIDIFAESFGWVIGKATAFSFAVMAGVGIGLAALMAGSAVGGAPISFYGPAAGMKEYLTYVTAILPQVIVLFWAGMIFVKSEKAEARHWLGVVALEAIFLTASFSRAIPGGVLAQVAAWVVVIGGIAAFGYAVFFLERHQTRKGINHLERLMHENAIRRAELKKKFGTESASAIDLGLIELDEDRLR